MTEWNVSKEAAQLHKDAHVWDMTMPWEGKTALKYSALRSNARLRTVARWFLSLSLLIETVW